MFVAYREVRRNGITDREYVKGYSYTEFEVKFTLNLKEALPLMNLTSSISFAIRDNDRVKITTMDEALINDVMNS